MLLEVPGLVRDAFLPLIQFVWILPTYTIDIILLPIGKGHAVSLWDVSCDEAL